MNKFSRPILFLFIHFCLFHSSSAQIRLPRLISNGMVLQRNKDINIWGWATPGEDITLIFKKKTYNTTTNAKGSWSFRLPPQQAGGPYDIVLKGSNSLIIRNILIGDVWICSGQSNMEISMERVKEKYPADIAAARNTHIRQFTVPDKYSFNDWREDIESGEWIPADQQHILSFSAVAYFFARDIFEKYKIPIGLINAAHGGAPADSWISEDSLKKFPDHWNELQRYKDSTVPKQIEENDKEISKAWYELLNKTDEGLKNSWENPLLDDSTWDTMLIPGYWPQKTDEKANGVVWFRKDIIIPASLADKPAKLWLGRIIDADAVFVNGALAGSTSYQYPPRRYQLSRGLLREGKNSIVIRGISNAGRGAFAIDKPYELVIGNKTIDLKGPWKYKRGNQMDELPATNFLTWKPTGLFNAMIAPILKFSIKGVIWYQGEANTDKPSAYAEEFQTMIRDWRSRWNQGSFPFLFVQLANFMEASPQPQESNIAVLRQAQLQSLQIPNTGMATAIDLGEWNDLHPLNKKDVGKRLALQAKRLAYGDTNLLASGPLYESMQLKENKLIISFTNTGKGLLVTGNKELRHFAVAGTDKKFVWAKAMVKGNQVIVWNSNIPHPVFVRYAWADNPQGANLYNNALLPASPFEARLSSN